MSGKGSGRRPAQVDDATLLSNWERIFNSGLPERSKGTGSNPVTGIAPNSVGSNPTAAANKYGMVDIYADMSSKPYIYIDDATGMQVSEDWWPGDESDV